MGPVLVLLVLLLGGLAPVGPEPLLDQLADSPAVRRELLGRAEGSGLVQCGWRPLGRRGTEHYAWLLCGSWTTGPRASMVSGGASGVVLTVDQGRLTGVRFPRQAHLSSDIDRLFPADVAPYVRAGGLIVSPSEGELTARARKVSPASACRLADLRVTVPTAGGPAGGSWSVPLSLTDVGAGCALETGSLVLTVGDVRRRLDLADRDDLVDLPSGWSYEVEARVPWQGCAVAHPGRTSVALSEPDGSGRLVLAGAVPEAFARCSGVTLSPGAPSATPSR